MTPCSLVEILVDIYLCPLNIIYQTSLHALHPINQQSSGKFIVLCVVIFALLNGGWKDKRLLMQEFLKFNLLIMLYKCNFDLPQHAEYENVRCSIIKYLFQHSHNYKSIE
jgi:hypothetical protein